MHGASPLCSLHISIITVLNCKDNFTNTCVKYSFWSWHILAALHIIIDQYCMCLLKGFIYFCSSIMKRRNKHIARLHAATKLNTEMQKVPLVSRYTSHMEQKQSNFYVLLTMHPGMTLSKWPTSCTIMLHNMFITIILYMFWATLCSSSGGQIVLIQHLV